MKKLKPVPKPPSAHQKFVSQSPLDGDKVLKLTAQGKPYKKPGPKKRSEIEIGENLTTNIERIVNEDAKRARSEKFSGMDIDLLAQQDTDSEAEHEISSLETSAVEMDV